MRTRSGIVILDFLAGYISVIRPDGCQVDLDRVQLRHHAAHSTDPIILTVDTHAWVNLTPFPDWENWWKQKIVREQQWLPIPEVCAEFGIVENLWTPKAVAAGFLGPPKGFPGGRDAGAFCVRQMYELHIPRELADLLLTQEETQ